ncbi:DUF6629 family protein [Streptomyces vietnamensis]|uniref:Integral membrane protein n=1 Tax=Streptomyces vietnamensis TaxID=362257 RepID=A0A0B5ILL3_9ACTN|nr:DUF6629 family protein [Streptomyces vietnamensis]AJF69249.1 hypothetical protein SVTN_38290 [Streptomyces vietnamensis]
MCWSATADLWAGLGIGAVGVVSLASVRRPGDAPLAALPLLLGAHQLVEAAVWHAGGGTGPATLAWAVIALPLLPLWVPLGVLTAARPATRPRRSVPLTVAGPRFLVPPAVARPRLLVPPAANRSRLLVPSAADRLRLLVPLAVGLATASVLAYRLATRPVSAETRGHTLGYTVDLPYAPLVLAGYLLATIGALLLARDRLLRILGLVTGAGAAVCALLWRTEFVSTWCALAAVASLLLLVWVRRRPRSDPNPTVTRRPLSS